MNIQPLIDRQSISRIGLRGFHDHESPDIQPLLLGDESMSERTTTQVFGLAMATLFAGILLLNAIS